MNKELLEHRTANNMASFLHVSTYHFGTDNLFYEDDFCFRAGISQLWPAGQIQPAPPGFYKWCTGTQYTTDVSMALHASATDRLEELWQKLYGPQSLNHLLIGPLQKKVAEPCFREMNVTWNFISIQMRYAYKMLPVAIYRAF